MAEGYKDRHEYSLDSRQLGIFLLAVAALAALIFVLGVSVGIQWQKRTSSETASQADMAAGADEVTGEEAEPGLPAAPAVDPAYMSEKDEKDESSGKAKEVAEKDDGGSALEPEKLTFPKTLTSKVPSKPAPRAEKTASAPRAGKAAAKAETGSYTVQVGAFKEKGSASRLVERLKKKGYKAEYRRTDGANGLYRVRVGSFASLADARGMAAKLETKEGLKPYVTSY